MCHQSARHQNMCGITHTHASNAELIHKLKRASDVVRLDHSTDFEQALRDTMSPDGPCLAITVGDNDTHRCQDKVCVTDRPLWRRFFWGREDSYHNPVQQRQVRMLDNKRMACENAAWWLQLWNLGNLDAWKVDAILDTTTGSAILWILVWTEL